MKYRVQWDADAFRRLRQIWIRADEPQSALQAFDAIEKRQLSSDAEQQGESRAGDRRILIVPPLGVIFRARPEIGEVLSWTHGWSANEKAELQTWTINGPLVTCSLAANFLPRPVAALDYLPSLRSWRTREC